MAIIEAINVLFRGETSSLDKSVDKSVSSLNKFKSGSQGAANGASSSLGGLGIVAGATAGIVVAALGQIKEWITSAVNGVVSFISESLTRVGQLGKEAQRLGVGVQSFQALQLGATSAGISAESLTEGMTHLNEQVSQAAHGAGEAGTALAKLGINAQQLNNQTGDKQLETLADGLKKVTNQHDKLAVAQQLFGRGNTQFIDILSKGSQSLRDMKDRASELGQNLSTEQVAAVQKANSSWSTMKSAFSGIGNTLAVYIAPLLTKVTGWLTDLFGAINKGVVAALPYWNAFQDTVSAVWDVIVSAATSAWKWYNSLFKDIDKAIANNGLTWNNFKEGFLTALFTVQFATQNFGKVFTELLPAALKVFGSFAKDFFVSLVDNIAENVKALWDAIKNGEAPKLVWKDMGDGWKESLKDMQKAVDKSGLGDFLKKKFAEFGKNAGKDLDKGIDSGASQKLTTGAALAGTNAAFSIIANSQGDKMFQVQNDMLKENKKMSDALKRIADQLLGNKLVIGRARL